MNEQIALLICLINFLNILYTGICLGSLINRIFKDKIMNIEDAVGAGIVHAILIALNMIPIVLMMYIYNLD